MTQIELPPSKSVGVRYMVGAYFAGSLPADPLFDDNDDLMVFQEALLEIYSDEEPIDYGDSPIDVGASATALRFITAVCASSPGADYIITGTPRLMQRPMKPLLEVLKEAGAIVESLGENGTGPYRVKGNKLKGGEFSITGDISSQFISALMLVAPTWEKGMILNFTTSLVSRPYVEMTAKVMRNFGIKVELKENSVKVDRATYIEPQHFSIDADWSSASFFYEAVALGINNLMLENLPSPDHTFQGDAKAAEIFNKIGVDTSFKNEGALLTISSSGSLDKIELNFSDFPDLMLPFAVACLCKGIKFRFDGVSHLRVKESDRILSLQTEAKKLGFEVIAAEDMVEWNGKTLPAEENPEIDPHDDHRVAMAFAMAALKFGRIRIAHPEVVEKSFIDFWNQIDRIGLQFVDGAVIKK